MTELIITSLKKRRENYSEEFASIFKAATSMFESIDEDLTIQIPRRAKKQTMRCNYQANSPEEYFKLSIYIPFLDHTIARGGWTGGVGGVPHPPKQNFEHSVVNFAI